MKTNDLRTTLLIIAGTLLATFLLGGWWVSRQAAALSEIRHAKKQAELELASVEAKRNEALAEIAVIQTQASEMKRKARLQ